MDELFVFRRSARPTKPNLASLFGWGSCSIIEAGRGRSTRGLFTSSFSIQRGKEFGTSRAQSFPRAQLRKMKETIV